MFEKTSTLLNSNIIISKQDDKQTMDFIKKNISTNLSKKIIFNEDFSYSFKENNFFYYEDRFGGLKLPMPNILGKFQLENISTAIATLKTLRFEIKDEHIINGIKKINNLARLQEIKSGKLKNLVKNNKLFVDGSHNPLGAKVLNEYLKSLNCNKHLILGMMANKNHNEFFNNFDNISSLTTIDIPNQPNSIKGQKLKDKLSTYMNVQYENNIFDAIKSISVNENDIIIITGSLYLAGEVLNLN